MAVPPPDPLPPVRVTSRFGFLRFLAGLQITGAILALVFSPAAGGAGGGILFAVVAGLAILLLTEALLVNVILDMETSSRRQEVLLGRILDQLERLGPGLPPATPSAREAAPPAAR